MISAGVYGGRNGSLRRHLKIRLEQFGLKIYDTQTEYDETDFDIKLADIKSDEISEQDVVIVVSETGFDSEMMKKDSILIINADECRNISKNKNTVSCGISSHADITFSGINEYLNGRETIQCCIQNPIKTVSGRMIEPQEFGVDVLGKYPMSEVLMVITASLLLDV